MQKGLPSNASLTWYAHELQQALRLPVEVGNFVARGAVSTPLPSPCAIVGIRPYAAGGTRQLILNAASPLVARCSALCAPSAGPRERYAAIALGTAMLDTGNWPQVELDSPVPTNQWNRVLNSGPMTYHICPMYLIPRMVGRVLRESKDLKTVQENVETIGDRLRARDDALILELELILQSSNIRSNDFASSFSNLLNTISSSRAEEHRKQMTPFPIPKAPAADAPNSFLSWPSSSSSSSSAPDSHRDELLPYAIPEDVSVLTYSSMLPVLLWSFSFAFKPDLGPAPPTGINQGDGVVPAERLGHAFWELGGRDRLFCLSLWFRIPLIDRTGILEGPVRVALDAPYCRPMVTKTQVEEFQARGTSLEEACMQRARDLWAETEIEDAAMDMQVAWSGGIDSTTALVCLMTTAKEKPGRWERLVVVLDDESVSEYPVFYEKFIAGADPPVREIRGDGKSLASIAAKPDRLTITGELGDQLFGSDKTKQAFLPPVFQNVMTGEDLENHFAKGLDAPWQDTVLPSLRDEGLLCGTERQWEEWIQPQLQRSPVPIRSTFDMLWWLNFSCKWRQVSLRCINDVGPIPPAVAGKALARGAAPGSVAGVLGGFRHFFDDAELECWSCCPDNHESKYLDRADWQTYKEPLKQIILHYTNDLDYFTNKTKVGSLFREGEASLFSASHLAILAGSAHLLRWGALSLCSRVALDRYGQSVLHLLPGRGQLGPSVAKYDDTVWRFGPSRHSPIRETLVDPWRCPPLPRNPFDSAPGFVETDERMSRMSNPVTGVTLLGKCAALLPASLVRGRSVLDLGACLGAMCHYALSGGAREAVAVDAQPELCERARQLLGQCWTEARHPDTSGPGPTKADGVSEVDGAATFRVVQSGIQEFLAECVDGQFDVVVAAGVLHCFTNPVHVVSELVRVAGVAVVVESVHPHVTRQGAVVDSAQASAAVRGAGALMQVTPNSRCNLAGQELSLSGLAVVPTRQLVEDVCRALGMHTVRVWLQPHPDHPDDVMTYCGARRHCATPLRFFLRCYHARDSARSRRLVTLEDQVLSGEGEVTGWNRYQRIDNTFAQVGEQGWTPGKHAEAAIAMQTEVNAPSLEEKEDKAKGDGSEPQSAKKTHDKAAAEERPAAGASDAGSWAFNEEVARNFDDIARKHIPDYQQIVDLSVELVTGQFGPHRDLSSVRVVDVGSATGNTLQALLDAGVTMVEGVDASEHMNAVARQKLPPSVRVQTADSIPAGGEYDAVLANWTVHFVKGERERERFLGRLVAGLAAGGVLMLTEKTTQTETMKRLYTQWKRGQGATEREIEAKRTQLAGVLDTLPAGWYERVLSRAGLVDVGVVWSRFGFVTWVGYKQESALRQIQYGGVAGCEFHAWSVEQPDDATYHSTATATEHAGPAYSVWAWNASRSRTVGAAGSSVYGFVMPGEGSAQLALSVGSESVGEDTAAAESPALSFTLREGMYFVAPGSVTVTGGAGVLVMVAGFTAMTSIGGPIEAEGRLPYIDGCSDSLLLPPPRLGDPCFNHLHFPGGVVQTRHTHPSGRAGMVAKGRGTCVWVDPAGAEQRYELRPGVVFVIPTDLPHSFETAKGDTLDVIAFHPDSDYGPTGDSHPMINRTMVGGVSASWLTDIRTSE